MPKPLFDQYGIDHPDDPGPIPSDMFAEVGSDRGCQYCESPSGTKHTCETCETLLGVRVFDTYREARPWLAMLRKQEGLPIPPRLRRYLRSNR